MSNIVKLVKIETQAQADAHAKSMQMDNEAEFTTITGETLKSKWDIALNEDISIGSEAYGKIPNTISRLKDIPEGFKVGTIFPVLSVVHNRAYCESMKAIVGWNNDIAFVLEDEWIDTTA